VGLLLDKWITLATETIVSSAIVNYEKIDEVAEKSPQQQLKVTRQ
jgi:hypothetical protein